MNTATKVPDVYNLSLDGVIKLFGGKSFMHSQWPPVTVLIPHANGTSL